MTITYSQLNDFRLAFLTTSLKLERFITFRKPEKRLKLCMALLVYPLNRLLHLNYCTCFALTGKLKTLALSAMLL